MARFNHFLYGFIPGLLLPLAFMWVYLNRFYPGDLTFWETIRHLYPGLVLGKLFMLSILPNLVLVFMFYKTDSFKIAGGIMIGGIPYLVASIFMM